MRPAPAPGSIPPSVAALLVQVGSFLLAMGTGVVIVAFAYGGRSFGVGLALLAGGYAMVGLPRWWLVRVPAYRLRARRLLAGWRSGGEERLEAEA